LFSFDKPTINHKEHIRNKSGAKLQLSMSKLQKSTSGRILHIKEVMNLST